MMSAERKEPEDEPDEMAEKPHATKFDIGKPPIGLIPTSALFEEAGVLDFGAKKYGPHNWRKGMEWQRMIDAALRHITQFNDGEDMDPESGYHHLAHARCCLGFLIEYTLTHPELDNRHVCETRKQLYSLPQQTPATEKSSQQRASFARISR